MSKASRSRPHPRRTNRRFVRFGASALVLLALAAGSASLLLPTESPDPTRQGPARTLNVERASVEARPSGRALVVRGATTLVDGATLQVAVLLGEREVLSRQAEVRGGAFALEETSGGEVTEGQYEVRVRFELSRQPVAVCEALAYQPASLEARRALSLPLELALRAGVPDSLHALLDEANRVGADAARAAELDRQAAALGERLWIGQEKAALRALRLALEEAQRPHCRREEFDRLLLQAYVLAGR